MLKKSTSSKTAKSSKSSKRLFQPLDRVAIALIVVLSIVMGIAVVNGSQTAAQVRGFSWQGTRVGAEDTAFILTFSRPMDRRSVEENLTITPELPGKFSWAGRRMAYTLEQPAPYGQSFTISLANARDRFTPSEEGSPMIQPFEAQFQTRDRAFVYLGVQGEEAGRLILYNLTQQNTQILTPASLSVIDFQPYPEGDRILFSATESNAGETGFLNQKLYTVTTGLTPNTTQSPWQQRLPWRRNELTPVGTVDLVLDSDQYQNLKFDLSPDGQTIVVQRVNRNRPSDFGPWMIRAGEKPQPIDTDPGGNFLITPDSSALVLAQGEGLAVLPLQAETEPLNFLPTFGMVLSFARDGSAAAMVKYNTNYTRSLFLVTNQGEEIELLSTDGSILNAQFDPTKRALYCLITNRVRGDDYLEQPLLVAIDLDTKERTDLLLLPIQRDIEMSLAPDGLGLLFDQTVTADPSVAPNDAGLQSSDGRAIADARLWFLPVTLPTQGTIAPTPPEALPLAGLRPRWLP
jgi:hypothetical protein